MASDALLDDGSYDQLSSSPSIHEEEINFEYVYALRTFVATEHGQANAVKGDTMILLNDTNSYWWLVRLVKDSSVGFLPAEHIETPLERLARLNKHRNADFCVSTNKDTTTESGSTSSFARMFNKRKTSNSSHTKPTAASLKAVAFKDHTVYVSASEYEYSDDEGDALDFDDEDSDQAPVESEDSRPSQNTSGPANSAEPMSNYKTEALREPRESDEYREPLRSPPIAASFDDILDDQSLRQPLLVPRMRQEEPEQTTDRSDRPGLRTFMKNVRAVSNTSIAGEDLGAAILAESSGATPAPEASSMPFDPPDSPPSSVKRRSLLLAKSSIEQFSLRKKPQAVKKDNASISSASTSSSIPITPVSPSSTSGIGKFFKKRSSKKKAQKSVQSITEGRVLTPVSSNNSALSDHHRYMAGSAASQVSYESSITSGEFVEDQAGGSAPSLASDVPNAASSSTSLYSMPTSASMSNASLGQAEAVQLSLDNRALPLHQMRYNVAPAPLAMPRSSHIYPRPQLRNVSNASAVSVSSIQSETAFHADPVTKELPAVPSERLNRWSPTENTPKLVSLKRSSQMLGSASGSSETIHNAEEVEGDDTIVATVPVSPPRSLSPKPQIPAPAKHLETVAADGRSKLSPDVPRIFLKPNARKFESHEPPSPPHEPHEGPVPISAKYLEHPVGYLHPEIVPIFEESSMRLGQLGRKLDALLSNLSAA